MRRLRTVRSIVVAMVFFWLSPVELLAQTTTSTTTLPGSQTVTTSSSNLPTISRPAQPGPRLPQAGQDLRIPFVDLTVRNPQNNKEVALSVQLLLVLAVLSLAPSLIIMVTSFLRVSIVFDFVKRALSLQSVPPTQVLLGISLFLTLFIMWPTFTKIYNEAYVPFNDGKIGIEEAYTRFEGPLRVFMYKQMAKNPEPIRLFMKLSNQPKPNTLADVPTYVIIPAFILNEMTVAFKIGILIFIPFVIIDMVVASILMSMGMIMLPPVMISMPFKLILFVLVDGWTLLTQQLVQSFT
jgi:flagellar biosynthetic protein FliP